MFRKLENHGFLVRELTREDADKIFNILRLELGKDDNKPVQNKKLRILKREIEYVFNEPEHHVIGIEKDGTLIGVATCNDENNIPWLGHFVIDEKYRKTKASAMLLYYVVGIIYQDKIVQTKPIGDIGEYKSSIKKMPEQLGFDIIDPERLPLLKKIAGE